MGEARKLRDLAPWLEFSSFFDPKVQELLLALRDSLPPEDKGRAIDAYMVANATAEDPSRAIKHADKLARHKGFAPDILFPLLAELHRYHTTEKPIGDYVVESSNMSDGTLTDEEVLRTGEVDFRLAPWDRVVQWMRADANASAKEKENRTQPPPSIVAAPPSIVAKDENAMLRLRREASKEKKRREKILEQWKEPIAAWQNSMWDPSR